MKITEKMFPVMKKITIGVWLTVIFCSGCNQGKVKLFQEKGVKKTARIASIEKKSDWEHRTASRMLRVDYKLTLTFFTDPKFVEADSSEKYEKEYEFEFMEKLAKRTRMGDFTMVDIVVSRDIYEKYREGDDIDIYYLPDNPENIMLASKVER
jgi:hypothetical protein